MPNNSATDNTTTTLFQTQPLTEFSCDKDTWPVWEEKLSIHLVEIGQTSENGKKATLLKSIGADAYNILHSLCYPAEPVNKTFKELCEILSSYFTPPTIVFRERKAFMNATRKSDETVVQWHASIKKLALNCKFGVDLDSFVLNKFVSELPEKIFQKICEEDEKLNLTLALKKAMIFETKFTSNNEEQNVNFIKRNRNYGNKNNNSKPFILKRV